MLVCLVLARALDFSALPGPGGELWAQQDPLVPHILLPGPARAASGPAAGYVESGQDGAGVFRCLQERQGTGLPGARGRRGMVLCPDYGSSRAAPLTEGSS